MNWLRRLFGRPVPAEAANEPGVDAALDRALALAEAGDYAAALALWEPLARAGHPRAQHNIAACFARGLGVEADMPMAVRWLEPAAAAGYLASQRYLADLYFRGEGVAQDDARAMALYRAGAEGGDADAQDMLSWMLIERNGDRDRSDPDRLADAAEGRRWAEMAAARGHAASMTRLGLIFHEGLGVERDPATAAAWWRRGAERGDAGGQAMLGASLHMGQGVAPDPVEALAWLLRATEGGSPLAAPFLPTARAALDAAGQAEAARRAALPFPEPAR